MKKHDDVFKKVIADIGDFTSRAIKRNLKNETFELRPYQWLLSNLTGWHGGLFVRSILYHLKVNEHHVFRWRLENKYMQYLVLDHYIPDCMPATFGLSEIWNRESGRLKINRLLKRGFFLKATLGYGSGKKEIFDRTAELDEILTSYQVKNDLNEKWILQKKLNLKEEFRVHTFDKNVIYGLTFVIQGLISSANYLNAEGFLKMILEKLPAGILQGSLIGWDIGLTEDDEYYIIEANFTGFHPEYHYGFQTSGYVEENPYGPVICAWLNTYFRCVHGVSIGCIGNDLASTSPFYEALIPYLSIFRNKHFEMIRDKMKDTLLSVVVYMGEETKSIIFTLIGYFKLANFADKYYLILKEECFDEMNELFSRDAQVSVLPEDTLFTKDQYQLIKQLNYERRKQICCYHALRLVKEEKYMII